MNDLNVEYWNERHKQKGKYAVGHAGMGDALFNQQTELFHGHIATEVNELMEELNRFITVLDYGCGYGRLMERLDLLDRAYGYIGVDVASGPIGQLKDKGVPARLVDQHNLMPTLSRLHTDIVVCCTVLQHIMNDVLVVDLIRKFYEITPEHGRILLIENVHDAEAKDYIAFRNNSWYVKSLNKNGLAVLKEKEIICRGETHIAITAVKD